MKKILFAMAMLVGALAPAHADSLPDSYIGVWCFYPGLIHDHSSGYSGGQVGDCSDGYIEIKRSGYNLSPGDDTCKFISIKHNWVNKGARLGRKEDWVSVIRIVGNCVGEVGPWVDRRELSYSRGQFTAKNLNPSSGGE
jgi:hypothetical protein